MIIITPLTLVILLIWWNYRSNSKRVDDHIAKRALEDKEFFQRYDAIFPADNR